MFFTFHWEGAHLTFLLIGLMLSLKVLKNPGQTRRLALGVLKQRSFPRGMQLVNSASECLKERIMKVMLATDASSLVTSTVTAAKDNTIPEK